MMFMTRSYHLYRTDKIRATSRRILPFCAVLVVDAAAVVAVAAAAAAAAVLLCCCAAAVGSERNELQYSLYLLPSAEDQMSDLT